MHLDILTKIIWALFFCCLLSSSISLSLFIFYHRRLRQTREKCNRAIATAQELSHRAALSPLIGGIAHEVRNPMGLMQSNLLLVADQLEGIKRLKSDYEEPGDWFSYTVRPEDFLGVVNNNREQAVLLYDHLIQKECLHQSGSLNAPFNTYALHPPSLSLDAPFNTYQKNTEAVFKRLLYFHKLVLFFNVAMIQFDRVLRIVDSMTTYGISGEGVHADSFAKIPGVSETISQTIFSQLIQKNYIDTKGCIITNKGWEEPAFIVPLDGICKKWREAVTAVVRSTPGAIKKPIDVTFVLEECITVLSGNAKEKGIVFAQEKQATPPILADEIRLHQAFFNVLLNAIQSFECGAHDLDKEKTIFVRVLSTAIKNPYGKEIPGIEVHIQDTGPGIAKEIKDRIFDAFFTTKNPHNTKNFGLGLALLKEVILQHNGTIEVESEIGIGTTFKLFFPVASSSFPA